MSAFDPIRTLVGSWKLAGKRRAARARPSLARITARSDGSQSKAIPGLDQFFGFARALAGGCAFAVKIGQVVQFVGWQRKIKLRPGMILLDATADIDGVSLIVPWRHHTKTPQAHYGNLEIVHVPQHTKKRLSDYLKKAANQRAYVKWMVETIRQHMAPGERGLVVCKKVLFDA